MGGTEAPIGPSAPIAVIGAGTMGAGIAQVAVVAGHPVMIYDVADGAASRAVSSIRERIAGLVAKGRLDTDPAELRLAAASGLDKLAPARLVDDAPGLVVTRTVAMLVNGAVDALHKGVASAADIDTVMRLGTNYPLGPLAWGQSWGPAVILAALEAMQGWYGEDRYRPSALLRRVAVAGGSLVPVTKEKA